MIGFDLKGSPEEGAKLIRLVGLEGSPEEGDRSLRVRLRKVIRVLV